MKAILRKGIVVCAAVLMGANVMAQSFDLAKEFQGDNGFWGQGDGGFWGNVIGGSLTKDGNPRMLFLDGVDDKRYGQDNDYIYQNTIDKLTILDKNLNAEKEFTSGPLFDEYTTVKVKSAVKTLKVESVDTLYSGGYGSDYFYDYYSWRIYNEETGSYEWYHYYELLAHFTEDEVRNYVEGYIKEKDYNETTFIGERFLFESYDVKESGYFDWGTQYPTEGWIYKDHDDICKVRINYAPDEYEEISRWNSDIYSAYCRAGIYCTDFIVDLESSAVITQSLFNDDAKYEFLLPVMEVFENSSYDNWSSTLTTEYRHKPIGYKIVSEDGALLHELIINAEKEQNMDVEAYVVTFGDKNYLVVYSDIYTDEEGYSDEVTRFYEIKKDGSGIQKVREMRGGMNIRPTVANRDEQITITLNDENSNVARELVVTGVNGQLVERRDIPAGENSVQIPASMLRSGMYNFTLQQKGQVVDNGKVIVK